MNLTKIVIYGKDGCPFCERAKKLSYTIKEENKALTIEYINATELNLTKEDIAKAVKKEDVKTFPQILFFFDEKEEYIGGFDDMYKYVLNNDLI